MLRNRLYYSVKPLIPWSVRMGVRRWFARRKRRHVASVWPILPGSERPPAAWPGWPEGKRFALVLTHDVEGPEGLARVKPLAELEMSLGLRSCFNFIPEGPYPDPRELRAWLVQNGFEVGVHDLRHDGNLFRSRPHFKREAARINSHLRDWNAAGFRAGFMLNQSEWLHDLNTQYDCSTFDTDPFEPQPHGQNTIFPFWVPSPETTPSSVLRPPSSGTTPPSVLGPQSSGYVELPYTLPQDSTLFLLLHEQTPEIWLRKLDWIAAHGGMALVNVHPDYLRFEGEAASARTYPVSHYLKLLQHVRSLSTSPLADSIPSSVVGPPPSVLRPPSSAFGNCWQALPREVAQFVTSLNRAPVRRQPRRICMVTHSFYARDNRVIRYAESLASRGDEVDVLSLRPGPNSLREEMLNGVRVFRVHDRFSKHGESATDFLLPILRFFFAASLWLTRHYGRRRYDLIHIHNIPDFIVFTAWYPRLRGARIILDIHDIVPEFFASKFATPFKSWRIRSLLLMERWSARFAHHVIIANHLWLDKYVARSARQRPCSVFINNVDANIFQPVARSRRDGRTIILFPGGLQWHQGLDIGLRAFSRILPEFPHAEFHIYGDGNMKPQLISLARELGLNGQVRFFDPLRVREIAAVMADADLGVVPKRADSFGNEAYSTKIMEFMALGVPVVVSSTKIDRFYFNDSVVRFFESGNPEAMAAAMTEVLRDQPKREQMVAQAREYAAQNSWASRKADYLNLVDTLCSRP